MNNTRFLKFLLLVNCAVPGALLAWDAAHGRLGANPVNFAILTTGMLTLVFIVLTLLVTPLRRLTGWNRLILFRRTLGLFAFFYGCLHFLFFFALDRALSVSSTFAEVVKRPYLAVGMLGLACMVPLAATSFNGAIRRLGARRWQLLHRLIYVTAIAGAIHFYWQSKADKRLPTAFACVIGGLLAYRPAQAWLGRRAKPAPAAATGPAPAAAGFWQGRLRVARITRETHDVRTFRLTAEDGGPLPFRHMPGQYLNLTLQIEGRRVGRSYTIASPPTRREYCELTIKRDPDGLASRHMHDGVREGDLLDVSAPAGRFTFTGAEADSIVLIAGGVGITPLMAILRALTDRDWRGEIFLINCVRGARDVIFADELASLCARFPNLHLHATASRPEEGDGWQGERGRLNAEMLARAVPGLAGRLCYLCGPTAMMAATRELLLGLGVAPERIRTEDFIRAGAASNSAAGAEVVAATDAPAEADAPGPPSVTFARSGKTVALAEGQTLLEAGEAAGLALDFDCRSGICGTCKTRLLAGRVVMDTADALSTEDHASGMILLCQAHARAPVSVDA